MPAFKKPKSKNWLYLSLCIILGLAGELLLFREEVGVSYSVFIITFYSFFFYLFRKNKFEHKQMNGLLFMTITILSMMFMVYANPIFYLINLWLLPFLMLAHTVLLTSAKDIEWHNIGYLRLLQRKLLQTWTCFKILFSYVIRKNKRRITKESYQTVKKIALGVLISIPLLFVIVRLLVLADQDFSHLLVTISEKLFRFQFDFVWRFLLILCMSVFFYCYFVILQKKPALVEQMKQKKGISWDAIIISTVLIFINVVYLLFTIVQFQYFFSATLAEGFTYAQYARRGFFELLFVTVINYLLVIGTLVFAKSDQNRLLKLLLTGLIMFTGILLSSAFLRLMLYELSYGFTYARVLAHALMIYLFLIFAYTLVKVWLSRLSLARFYIMMTLLFYVGLNVVGIDNIIVSNNVERYEQSGNIDVEYLSQLSYSAIPALVELYQEQPEIEGLEELLKGKREELQQEELSWQSYNLARQRALQVLERLE